MTDSIKRVTSLRNFYNNTNQASTPENELKEIKTELMIANNLKATEADANEVKTLVNSATGSPYLTDQPFYKKEVVYNSPAETSWKDVRTEEQNRRSAYNAQILKKLNIM